MLYKKLDFEFIQLPLFNNGGKETYLIPETHHQNLSLSKTQLSNLIYFYGAVLFRNFSIKSESFYNLVKTCSSRLSFDPGRPFIQNNLQRVNEGRESIGLHIENGSTPSVPDLLWFFCQDVGDSKPSTIICDGVQLWENLDNSIQELFVKNDIKYTRNVPGEVWRNYVIKEKQLDCNLSEVTLKDFKSIVSREVNTNLTLLQDDFIKLEVSTSAIKKLVNSNKISFSNSIFGPSLYNQKPHITFNDDRPIPPEVLSHIEEKAKQVTRGVSWKKGDLLILNNKRYMHGRHSTNDKKRNILVSMSYL